MSTIYQSATAEGLTDGLALVVSNDVTAANGFNSTTNPSNTSFWADSTSAFHGTRGYRITPTGGLYGTGKWNTSITGRPKTDVAVRGYFRYQGLNTANHYLIQAITSTGALDWRVQFSSAHRLMLLNLSGNIFVDASTTLVNNTWYRVDVWLVSATSYRVALFSADSTVPLFDTGVQALTATIATNEIDVGICNSGTGIVRLDIDDFAVGTGGLLGRPAGLPWAAPTVNMPVDVDKNVGDTFSLTATPVLGDGTAFTAYEWTIDEQSVATPTITISGGSTVTVSGTASKPGALVLKFRAKDNGGSLGSADTWSAYGFVTVYVSPDVTDKVRTRKLIGTTNWTAISTGSTEDDLDSTGMRSPDDPVNESWTRLLQPAKTGALIFHLRGLKVGTAGISRHVEFFTDSTLATRFYHEIQNPQAAVTDQTITVDAAGLLLIPTLASRRAMAVKVTSTKV
jgi:hypothetical protein